MASLSMCALSRAVPRSSSSPSVESDSFFRKTRHNAVLLESGMLSTSAGCCPCQQQSTTKRRAVLRLERGPFLEGAFALDCLRVKAPRHPKVYRNSGPENLISCTLRTPHSGYHFDGSARRFFEGWYFKVTLPDENDSFAFMYSIEDPAECSSLTNNANRKGIETLVKGLTPSVLHTTSNKGDRFPGIAAQMMGPGDTYLMHYGKDVRNFWASRYDLELSYAFSMDGARSDRHRGLRKTVSPEEFRSLVVEGFQASTTFHQGVLFDDGQSPEHSTVPVATWEYTTVPLYGWGDVGTVQKATAGWLAAFPVFEPHWQILMGAGKSTGWIEWGGRRYEFKDAPSYAEKNWGGSFPRKWFWIQCNFFEEVSDTIAVTAGGGRRGTPFAIGGDEEVAMIGIHYKDKFYEFVPWAAKVSWDIATWGSWKMSAMSAQYEVELVATADAEGVILRAPTSDAGLAPACKDTFTGKLQLKLWERKNGKRVRVILDAHSKAAALEVGGGPWWGNWTKESEMTEPIKSLISLPIDVGALLSPLPSGLSPPGL